MNFHAGSIKFNREVPLNTIREIAKDFQKGFIGEWKDLHIRAAGDDGTHYLAFNYDVGSEEKGYHDQFQCLVLRMLKHRLGIDRHRRPSGVKGWSMSNVLPL